MISMRGARLINPEKMINGEIHNRDYRDMLLLLPDNYVDLILIDPPYEINFNNIDWDKPNMVDWPFLFDQLHRVLKRDGNFIMFTGWSKVSKLLNIPDIRSFYFRNSIAWDRQKGRGAKKNFVSTREDILWFTKGSEYTFHVLDSTIRKKTTGMGKKNGSEYRRLSNVWSDIGPVSPMSKENCGYPAQKPQKLIERLLKVFSNEGDLVLDCFCGSGTTGVSCSKLKRKFILSDNEERAFEITKERIKNEQKGSEVL